MKQETGRRIARWSYMAVAAGYLWWNLARMTEFSWTFTIMPYLGDFGIIAAIFSLILGWKKRSPLVWTMTAGLGWMLLMSAIRGEMFSRLSGSTPRRASLRSLCFRRCRAALPKIVFGSF